MLLFSMREIIIIMNYYVVADSNDVVPNTELYMSQYVQQTGTLAIMIDATNWNTYVSGVMSTCPSNPRVNHAVQLVGVKMDSATTGVWKMRNQWGFNWGEQGFLRLPYGNNACALATYGGYFFDGQLNPGY